MVTTSRELERVLVVDDDLSLRTVIARWVRSWGTHTLEAGTVREAKARLARTPPDLIITDTCLPDGDGLAVLEAASGVSPVPIMIAISGVPSPDEAFRAARLGVRAYLSKPFSLYDLSDVVDAARREPPNLDPLICEAVGHIPMRELQDRVRRQMIKQAIALTGGSRSGAARLLGVSRQAVQQMLRNEAPVPSDSAIGRDGPAFAVEARADRYTPRALRQTR